MGGKEVSGEGEGRNLTYTKGVNICGVVCLLSLGEGNLKRWVGGVGKRETASLRHKRGESEGGLQKGLGQLGIKF